MHQRRNGEDFWAEVILTAILYDGETILHSVVRDISARKNLEQEREQLTAILEATPDYIGVASAKGEILWHNQQLRKLRMDLGKPDDHRQISECHPNWANEIILSEALPTAIQEGSWSGELALLDGEGQEIPVSQVIIAHKSADGTVENFSTVMRDIRESKRTEAALQLSEAQATAAFEQAAVGFVEVDMVTKKCVRVNNKFCTMTGYTQAELAEMTVPELTHPDDIAASMQAMKQLYRGEVDSFTLEKRHLRKDGSFFWSETTVYLVKLRGEEAVYSLALIQDISEKKQLEVERIAAEKALNLTQFAVENAATGFLRINAAGQIQGANCSICQTLGYTLDELKTKFVWDVNVNLNEHNWAKHYQSLRELSSLRFESHYRAKNQDIFPVEITSNYLEYGGEDYIFAQVQDIRDRKAAEDSLRESEEQFRTLVSNLDGVVYRCKNDADWTMAFISDPVVELSGYPADDFIQNIRSFSSIIHPDDSDRTVEVVEAALCNPNSLYVGISNYPSRWQYPLGPMKRVKEFLMTNGQLQFLEGVIFDISDRKTAEAEKIAYQDKLQFLIQKTLLGVIEWNTDFQSDGLESSSGENFWL